MKKEITAPRLSNAIRAVSSMYKQGFRELLHPAVNDKLLDMFCRGEEFAAAKHALEDQVKEIL